MSALLRKRAQRKKQGDLILGTPTPRQIAMQAPVAIIPAVLSLEFCRHLIHTWEVGGNEESYTMVEDEGGMLRKVFNRKQKIRRDHFLGEGETLNKLKLYTKSYIYPIVLTAFRFQVTRFEDFRLGCYEADSRGFFGPHRDDATEGTAHRIFAMSINLNADEYEGGYLRFPEYGSDLYKPDTGSAMIFSSALLHEVTPVTKGRRFALLSFLYGEQESEQRKAYYRRLVLQATSDGQLSQ